MSKNIELATPLFCGYGALHASFKPQLACRRRYFFKEYIAIGSILYYIFNLNKTFFTDRPKTAPVLNDGKNHTRNI